MVWSGGGCGGEGVVGGFAFPFAEGGAVGDLGEGEKGGAEGGRGDVVCWVGDVRGNEGQVWWRGGGILGGCYGAEVMVSHMISISCSKKLIYAYRSFQYPVRLLGVSNDFVIPFDDQMPRCLLEQRRAWELLNVELWFCGHL